MSQEILEVYYPPHLKLQDRLCFHKADLKLYLTQTEADQTSTHLNVATVPKSGTHLLTKALKLLSVSYKTRSDQELKVAPHLLHYLDLTKPLTEESLREAFPLHEKYIVTIRDPKDFIISALQWIDNSVASHELPYEDGWDEMSSNEAIHQILNLNQNPKFECLNQIRWMSYHYEVAAALYKMALPNILFLKFEDLIGPELGGNCKEKQIEAWTKLCKFTDVKITAKKIQQLIKLFPGNTLTYKNQKKTGKWRQFFQAEHMQTYLKNFYPYEKLFGYETYFPTPESDIKP